MADCCLGKGDGTSAVADVCVTVHWCYWQTRNNRFLLSLRPVCSSSPEEKFPHKMNVSKAAKMG